MLIIAASCSPTKVVDCPPKFTIYKKVEKAYPVYARDFVLQLKNSISTADKLQDTAAGEIKSSVVRLRENLNNISSRVEMLTKSNLLSYFSGVCDPNMRKSFADFQNKLADLTLQLTQIEAKIENTKAVGSDVKKNVAEAVSLSEKLKTDASAAK
jgi:hypothetical protein